MNTVFIVGCILVGLGVLLRIDIWTWIGLLVSLPLAISGFAMMLRYSKEDDTR